MIIQNGLSEKNMNKDNKNIKRLSLIALSAILPLNMVTVSANYNDENIAETYRELIPTRKYSTGEVTTVTNGAGAINAASDVSLFDDISNFTFNTTFTATGGGVNSLFYIGDKNQKYNYIVVYALANGTIGIEGKGADSVPGNSGTGAPTIINQKIQVAGADFSKEHKLTFTITGGSNYSIYLDGNKVLSGATTTNFTKDLTGENSMVFGNTTRGNGGNDYRLTGTLKNIELYDSALTEEQIKEYHLGALERAVYTKKGIYNAKDALITEQNDTVVNAVRTISSGSVSVRFKANTTNGGLSSLLSFSNKDAQNEFVSLYINQSLGANGRIGLDGGNDAGASIRGKYVDLTGDLSIKDTYWHTITLTKDGSVMKIYLDGEEAGSFTGMADGFFNVVSNGNAINFGYVNRVNSSSKMTFDGSIDDARIYSEVLTAADVKLAHSVTTDSTTEVVDLSGAYKTTPEAIYYAGYEGSAGYRIPSMVTTPSGTIIAGIDKRNDGPQDSGNIDNVVRRKEAGSSDFGEIITVIDLLKNPSSGKSALTMDSSLLMDEESGRVYMLMDMFPESGALLGHMGGDTLQKGTGYTTINDEKYLTLFDSTNKEYVLKEVEKNNKIVGEVYAVDETDGVKSFGEKTAYTVVIDCPAPYSERGNIYENGEYKGNIYMLENGKDKGVLHVTKTEYLWLSYSDDEGKTWSNPVDITKDVKEDWMLFLGVGPGRGLKLENGRLCFPVYSTHEVVGSSQASALIYSDDNGETWQLGESPLEAQGIDRSTMNNSAAQVTESQLVQLQNGKVVLFMRNMSNNVKYSTSSDNGKTWDIAPTEIPELKDIGTGCMLSVVSFIGKDGNEYVLMSNPESNTRRIDGKVSLGKVNEDGTISWDKQQLIQTGPYAYSCLTEMLPAEDGTKRFALMYELGDYGGLRYTEFDENFINAGLIGSDFVAPEVVSHETKHEGNNLTVELTFNQKIIAVGQPKLKLMVGNNAVDAEYVSGSGSETITFNANLSGTETGIVKAIGFDFDQAEFENIKNKTVVDFSDTLFDLTKVTSGLSISDYSSQHSDSTAEGQDGAARNVLDGNIKTYWHSTWGNPSITLPQFVTVKLEEAKSIYKLGYTARQTNLNGCAKDYTIEVSKDGKTFTEHTSGQLNSTTDTQYIEFTPTEDIQYVKFIVNSTHTGGTSTAISELELFEYSEGALVQGDTTKLEAAVQSIEEVLTEGNYSTASFDVLKENLKEAKECIAKVEAGEHVSQSKVDAVCSSLTKAYKGLVDITSSFEVNDRLNALNENDYTPESWQAFEEVRNGAVFMDEVNNAASPKEVTDVIMKAEYAMSLLVEDVHRADYSEVDRLIALAEELDASKYTAQSYEAVMDAVEAVERGLEASRQEEVDAMAEAIQSAIDALVREYAVLVNGEEAARGVYNEKVTVKAPVVEGKEFTAWLFNGKVISTEAEYTFFLSEDMELTPCYEAVEMNAEALLTNTMLVKRADSKADIKFVAQLVVPTGYTVKDAGLVWSSKEGTELSLENKNLKPTYITRISNTNQFSVTIKGMPTGKFIRGRIFATLVDSEGNESVVYSDETRVVNK